MTTNVPTERKNKMYPVVKGLVGGAIFVVVSLFMTTFVLPAWAVSFEVGGRTIDLGAMAPWISILVTIIIWRDAHQARKKAEEAAATIAATRAVVDQVSKKTDGMLEKLEEAAKKRGIEEGEARGLQTGVDTAKTLAEGQRQGVEMERSRADDKSSPPSGGNNPLPVADDRTNLATESIAESMKRSADSAASLADTAKKASKPKE